jgi:hypothetical protein
VRDPPDRGVSYWQERRRRSGAALARKFGLWKREKKMKTCISKITLLAILAAAAIFAAAPSMAQVPTGPDVIFEWEYRTGYPDSMVVTDMQRCRLGTCTSVDFSPFEIDWRPGGGPELANIQVCEFKDMHTDSCDVYDCFIDVAGKQSVCNYLYSYDKNCYTENC